MTEQAKVLIVDDDRKLQQLMLEYLSGHSLTVVQHFEGLGVVERIASETPDIVVLDLMLPGRDGFQVLSELRKSSSIPVIMLTARGEETDRIVGLEMGADDYLPKPFSPRELLARMRAILRRRRLDLEEGSTSGEADGQIDRGSSEHREPQVVKFIDASGLRLDLQRRRLDPIVAGELVRSNIELSSTETALLAVLMGCPGKTYSREELLNMARGREFIATDRSVDVHISKIRARLATLPGHKKRIRTVWGAGYMFADTPPEIENED